MVVCMSFRGDGVAVLHSLWVAAFLFVQRKTAIKLWRFYVPYMAVMLPLQYLLILGWPPGWCNGMCMCDYVHLYEVLGHIVYIVNLFIFGL